MCPLFERGDGKRESGLGREGKAPFSFSRFSFFSFFIQQEIMRLTPVFGLHLIFF